MCNYIGYQPDNPGSAMDLFIWSALQKRGMYPTRSSGVFP